MEKPNSSPNEQTLSDSGKKKLAFIRKKPPTEPDSPTICLDWLVYRRELEERGDVGGQ